MKVIHDEVQAGENQEMILEGVAEVLSEFVDQKQDNIVKNFKRSLKKFSGSKTPEDDKDDIAYPPGCLPKTKLKKPSKE